MSRTQIVSPEEPYFLMSHLGRAMAHRLRTALSVVTNDLAYVGAVSPYEGIERTLSRCQEVAEVVSLLGLPLPKLRDKLDLAAISRHVVAARPSLAGTPIDITGDPSVRGDPALIEAALGFWAGGIERIEGSELRLGITGNPRQDSVELSFEMLISKETDAAPASFSSFTRCWNEHLRMYSIEGPLLDALLQAIDCIVCLSVAEGALKGRIEFESAEQ